MQSHLFTVRELYDCRALIMGLTDSSDPENPKILYRGFINEASVPEATKRAVYRIGKLIDAEVKTIDECRLKNQAWVPEEKEDEESLTEEQIKQIIQDNDDKIINDPKPIELQFNKIDFLTAFTKGVALSFNYQLLYDKIFKD